MIQLFELVLTCTQLWITLETAWILIINSIYFTIPWLIWGAIIIYMIMKVGARIPPPKDSAVKKVLGLDPLSFAHKEDGIITDAETDNQYCMRVIAHRGAGYDFPENSMSAFRNSREKGCDGIEFDLALTKDNIPILFHDVTIDRLTGFNGNIKDMTWSELRDFDISTTHPLKQKLDPHGEKIALFDEVLEETLENGQHMFIDIKATGHEIVRVILEAYKKHPKLYEKAVITSFNPFTIYMIRKKDPRIVAGLSWRPRFFSTLHYSGIRGPHESRFENLFVYLLFSIIDVVHDWLFQRITYYILGLSFILMHKDVVSAEVVRQWNDRGVRIIAWTVNLPTEKAHFARNLKVTYLTDTLLS